LVVELCFVEIVFWKNKRNYFIFANSYLVVKFNISHEIENYENATGVVEVYDPSVYHDLPKYVAVKNFADLNFLFPCY